MVADLEAQLAAAQKEIARLEQERARLLEAFDRLWHEVELMKRRMFVAKAERVDTAQLELEFQEKLAELDALAGTLGIGKEAPTRAANDDTDGEPEPPSGPEKTKERPKPKGRRDLRSQPIEEVRLELPDPVLEQLVNEGKATRIGFEESAKLARQRGGIRRLIVARVKYQAVDSTGRSVIETAPMPAQLLPRSLAAPSMLSYVAVAKHNDGLPLWRLEEIVVREGIKVDRGTMCRWLAELGGAFGATVVEAMRNEALSTAFCIASDATGIAVQPEPRKDRQRQACRRGHYFVFIADRDHIWFEYTPKETSAAVSEMFGNFEGYVQVDAKSVFDILFDDPVGPAGDGAEPGKRLEVGCWAHARRKYWEAALAKSTVAREALARIRRIFELDATWNGKPHAEIKRLRGEHLAPHVRSFFAWATEEYENVRAVRGPLRTALGYAVRQKDALSRFLDDGRLRLDNNPSELALRGRIAVGRKAWLFVGSDEHAESAANIMSLISSARLHKLDPEAYLRDLIRVLPHWPRDRYIELAPKYWAKTRSRLDPVELAAEIGELTIPEPLSGPAKQQPPPD